MGNTKGAVTWANAVTGIVGNISSINSLVGGTANDGVGEMITVLTNGNYIISSSQWNGYMGAATWGSSASGVKGVVSSSNSLVGSSANDIIGRYITPLSNGNYVVGSFGWSGNKGAATWGNGTTGITGIVNASNSIVGSVGGPYNSDAIGKVVMALTNGHYVIGCSNWDNSKGAALWCNGNTGSTGLFSATNALAGTDVGDGVGDNIIALSNGNYVVGSPRWQLGKGAATWCVGSGATSSVVTTANSLVGTSNNAWVGEGAYALTNGNYLVNSSRWESLRGALTWCDGTKTTSAIVSVSNSLTGSSPSDNVGYARPLPNGNYIALSESWSGKRGAITWCNGKIGTVGAVSAANSLVGLVSSSGNLGFFSGGFDTIRVLPTGDYIIHGTKWDNNRGAVCWGNGTGGTVGTPNTCNSVFGVASNAGSALTSVYNALYGYLLVGSPQDNIVARYYPLLGMALPTSSTSLSLSSVDNSPLAFIDQAACKHIVSLTPSGANPVRGPITVKTWIESPQPAYFVARHYEITPVTNPTGSTGTVTLLFDQPDFDAFNNQATPPTALLPTGPNDAVGKSHLLVEKIGGTSSVGTGLPSTYPGPSTTIDPADSNIVWNNTLQRWEVSFEVSGFSGFFVKTIATSLPLKLINFTGRRQSSLNSLQWTTSGEVGVKEFIVERSSNGTIFLAIGQVYATGDGKYQYVDASNAYARSYYRLKIIDADGKFTYSLIIWLDAVGDTPNVTLYPNPASDITVLYIRNATQLIGTQAQLLDAKGLVLQRFRIAKDQMPLTVVTLPAGLYFLKLQNGKTLRVLKK